MKQPGPKNHAASIRQRLLNDSRERGENYQRLLTRYAIERLLFRLSRTEEGERYVLKGATLFATWPEHAFRPTGDLDLLGYGDPTPATLVELFTRVCQVEEPVDGIVFDPASLRAVPARDEDIYRGIELTLRARLDSADIAIRIDIGFGDHVYPAPGRRNFPGLLPDLPAARLLMYPPETVIAEKFEAMVRFGEANTRIKDFYDIWIAARSFEFDLSILVEAIKGTLRRREVAAPDRLPSMLTQEFASRSETQALWTGFLRRNPPTNPPPSFDELVAELRLFLGPVIAVLPLAENARGSWNSARMTWE